RSTRDWSSDVCSSDLLKMPITSIQLLVPMAEPKKVILLAGNYASHILEGGGVAPERQQTYPYYFWKPPSTTLTHPGDPIRIPKEIGRASCRERAEQQD